MSAMAGMAEAIREAMKILSIQPQSVAHFLLDSVAVKLENESGDATLASWEKWASLHARVGRIAEKVGALEARLELLNATCPIGDEDQS